MERTKYEKQRMWNCGHYVDALLDTHIVMVKEKCKTLVSEPIWFVKRHGVVGKVIFTGPKRFADNIVRENVV